MSREVFLLPPSEDDEVRRLRETIDQKAAEIMRTFDAALKLRSAPIEAQRMRHDARRSLQMFTLQAMQAMHLREDRP